MMTLQFNNALTGKSVTTHEWPVVPRQGESVKLLGTEYHVDGVYHMISMSRIIVKVRPYGLARDV